MIPIRRCSSKLFSCKGEFRWQTRHGPTWDMNSALPGYLLALDSDIKRVEENTRGHNNMFAHILAVGDNQLTLLNAQDGQILTSAAIPRTPVLRPVLGDFSGDGTTDVIIKTEDSLLGYRLKTASSTRMLLVAFVSLAILSVLIFLANIFSNSGSTQSTPSGKRNTYSIIRSTDDGHLD